MDQRDAILIMGLTILSAGCFLVYPPAALIVPGVILVAMAIFGVR